MGGDVPYGERPAAGFTFTDAQVAHFCRQGYVVLRGVYDQAEVQRLREHASAALQSLTSQEAGVAVQVYAVEKNENAVVTLQNRCLSEPLWEHVTVVPGDMRRRELRLLGGALRSIVREPHECVWL